MAKIADKVFLIINQIVIDMGYELLGIKYVVISTIKSVWTIISNRNAYLYAHDYRLNVGKYW